MWKAIVSDNGGHIRIMYKSDEPETRTCIFMLFHTPPISYKHPSLFP